MSAVTTYALYANNPERMLEAIRRDPVNARETEYYRANIEKVKSLEAFVSDRRLFNYALKAYGLSDMSNAQAFMRKVLEGGIDDRQALANRLSDRRYAEFVTDFNFKRYGATTTTFDRTRQGVIDRYNRAGIEQRAGEQSEGARLALYFQRRAKEIDSPFDILADRALLKFVQVATGLPVQMSFQTIERQAELISQRLDISDLDDPQELQKLIRRFNTLWDVENPQAAAAPSAAFGTARIGLSIDILAAIQNYRRT
jgi:hypothetical protein